MQRTIGIEKVVTKVKLNEKKTAAAYWGERSYAERLTALEEIRQEYHQWKYGGESRMQKVVKIIQLNKNDYNRHQNLTDLENLE